MEHEDGVGMNEAHDPQEQILVAGNLLRGFLLELEGCHTLLEGQTLKSTARTFHINQSTPKVYFSLWVAFLGLSVFQIYIGS